MDTEQAPEDGSPFIVEPYDINFGCLKPREGSAVTIRVNGGPAKVLTSNERIIVTPLTIAQDSGDLEVSVLGGALGDMIWDSIVLQGETGEHTVIVTARWDETAIDMNEQGVPLLLEEKEEEEESLQKEEEHTVIVTAQWDETAIDMGNKSESLLDEKKNEGERTFKGRTCHWCKKNRRYDTASGSWQECEYCKGYRKIPSLIRRFSIDFYLGLKEIRHAGAETWEVIIGKSEQNK